MEPPPLSAAPPQAHLSSYADSVHSSPRSRNADIVDESLYPSPKLRLMCSYGGHIVPRPHTKSLCYVGGDTRIVVVDRQSSLSDLTHRLSKTLFNSRSFTLKYQLPNEDLDSLISVTTDEDLENMIDEYDRLLASSSTKSSRLRLFLFPSKPDSASSIGSLLENSTKSDDWFLNALNTTSSGFSESSSVNCLLGLDDDAGLANSNSKDVEPQQIESVGNNLKPGTGAGASKQDIHSVPDSPMLDTTSSFGSASSSPSLANLPPIRVHVVEDQKIGIEEHFSQMNTVTENAPPQNASQAPPPPMISTPDDDELQKQGVAVPLGYINLPLVQPILQQQPHIQYMQPAPVPHHQLKQTTAGSFDAVSPDSVSSEGSMKNPLSRQKPNMIYQDPIVQIPSTQINNNKPAAGNPNPLEQQPKISDPNTRVQIQQQQLQDSGYILQTQFDPQQHHPQMHPQQQFIHPAAQYIHHHPTGMPMAPYYPMYPSQQQHHPQHVPIDQQYPVYYMPTRQPQAYNTSMQQPSYSEAAAPATATSTATSAPSSRPQTPPQAAMAPPPAAYNPGLKPEMVAGGYRTATTATPLVQVPSSQYQAQYVGYSQLHPSQSIAPTSAANANYTYEYADPMQAHMYYTHAVVPQLAAQYQTMAASSGLAEDNMKQQQQQQQQIGTSQP